MPDLTGQTLGQYPLRELIGKGGMAFVYRAYQESMGREVAVKVMTAELSDNAEFLARFEREARMIARLQHPHILPVYDFGRTDEHVYLVMMLVQGGVLSERLKSGSLTLEQSGRLLEQIASALEYAHRRGVIHRDLKPNNVLLDELDNVYLTDFGIAKMLAGSTTGGASLTATGRVMGTPAYMAPEQWRSEPVDARTDIYALGVILYEMLLGTLPFQAETPFGMMYKHFDTPPPLPRLINPRLPEPVERVILQALAKDPSRRFASAQQLATAFNSVVGEMPPDTLTMLLPRATPEQVFKATAAAQTLADQQRATPPPPVLVPPAATPPTLAPVARPARRFGLRWALLALVVVAAAVIAFLALSDDKAGSPGLDGDVTSPESVTKTRPPLESLVAVIGEGLTRTPETADPAPVTTIGERTATFTPTDTLPPLVTATPRPSSTRTAPPSNTPRPTLAPPRTPTSFPTLRPSPVCQAMPVRVQINSGGRTTLSPAVLTRLRTEPAFDAGVVQAIAPGQTFWITGGPVCVENVLWWQVETATAQGGFSGWVGEGRNDTYWIEPFDTGPVVCPGAPPPRLVPGERGGITTDPPLASRVRGAPTTAGDVLDVLQPGETFRVISGPVCDVDNGFRWWHVEAGDLSGWVAEGSGDEYWMEPLPAP